LRLSEVYDALSAVSYIYRNVKVNSCYGMLYRLVETNLGNYPACCANMNAEELHCMFICTLLAAI